MLELNNKQVLVTGLGGRGQAACALLQRVGAVVHVIDNADSDALRESAKALRAQGVPVDLGASKLPEKNFDLAVVSPAVPANSPLLKELAGRKVPVIGELELGWRLSKCLAIGVSGTNGKGTTAELIERMLVNNHRKTILAGHGGRPVCSIADQTAELDFLVLQVNAFQLETTEFFRPAVSVLLNATPDHLDRYASQEDYIRAYGNLFRNQQAFDWAIVQAEALARLKALGLMPKSKTITFSAHDQNADIYLDRGLIISRIGNWEGPLLDTEHCRLRGPHNAENLMAALAVGRALRLSLENMMETLKVQPHGAHRFEVVAEVNGIQFINDSKATNPEALQHALLAARPGEGGKANVWLIAGGRGKGVDFHGVVPLISKRVKGAFLVGEEREKIRSAWSLFTPCTLSDSLLEAVTVAARKAAPGDVILLSPACSSFDQFQNYQQRGERFCQIVKSISWGERSATPNMSDKTTTA
ncbi:MAG TPA: UDP-N-acetylmuramoyl-L-alanine--D-glutamate ligase [Candidatus Paceibacterota bacterium]|nr:UDP-N-acetylmuramoyl-L-alanine--D-glutamate ligase [Candidatus Paceibacterota bacterium]